jgi:hypothetical protein
MSATSTESRVSSSAKAGPCSLRMLNAIMAVPPGSGQGIAGNQSLAIRFDGALPCGVGGAGVNRPEPASRRLTRIRPLADSAGAR